jgi:histidine ammonia-lyase
MAASDTLKLGSRPLHLADLRRIYSGPVTVEIDPAALRAVGEAHEVTARIAAADAPAYGINTGFGLLAQTRIAPAQRTLLQRNIILSHASGVGAPLDEAVVRLTLVLKLASLVQGFSGVSSELVHFLERLINSGLYPVVPSQGSVGASGDLAPLAHLSLSLVGQGEIRREARRSPPPRHSRRRASRRRRSAPRKASHSSTARRCPPRSRSRACSNSRRCSRAPW